MEQKVPKITDKDIIRLIKRDFKNGNHEEILKILKDYNSQTNKGRNRIYADVIKLSNGSLQLLKKYIKNANNDCRDIISQSEYPEYSKYAFDNIPEDQKNKIIDDDWRQYQAWFLKKDQNV